jgi:hypothetical protein
MRFSFLILAYFVWNFSFCQDFNLQADNKAYIASLDSCRSIATKLKLIKEKVLRDTVFIAKPTLMGCKTGGYSFSYTMFSNKWVDKNGTDAGKKILHVIFYKKGRKMMYLERKIEPNCLKILEQLNEKNIDDIKIFNAKESVIFGEIGSEMSSVVIYTTDRKVKKLIEKSSY